MRPTMLAILSLAIAAPAVAQSRASLPGSCLIERSLGNDSRDEYRLRFEWKQTDCEGGHHCGSSNSDMLWSRWSGIQPEDLSREGAHIDARMKADSGEMQCVGTIHAGALEGQYSFTPDEHFRTRLAAMGFGDLTIDNLQGYAMLDVSLAFVQGMQDAGVKGITAQNLMGLKALQVDPQYVRAMAAAGYPELKADKLTGMKAVGVSPEKVEAVRKMGYTPTEEELIQLSVFKIDAPFVERMHARGFKNLTISQLVQIKVFKLDE
jgi:hypothetical protein